MKIKFVIWLIMALTALASCGSPSFDPNLAAHEAQYQAERYAAMATGTAMAQVIPITQTGAAFAMLQTQAAATSAAGVVTQEASWTHTAQAWTPTPVPSPTPNAPMTATFSAMFAIQTRTVLDTQRAQTSNDARALFWIMTGVALLIVAVMYAYTHLKRLSIIPQPIHDSGKIHPLVNVIEGIATDLDRMPNGMVQLTERYIKSLPLITAGRQDRVTELAQKVDLFTRARLPKSLIEKMEGLPRTQPLALPEPTKPLDTNFLLPSWDLMNAWDPKDGLPYYTARGMETIDEKRYAHLAAIGATGSGKSRRFFRPVITCALSRGHRVVIIGKSADYWPFEGHVNATLLKVARITETGQAGRYARILEAIVEEMNRRDDVLTSARKSTWMEMGLPQTFIVLDELGNALRLMDRATSAQCRTWIEGLMAESRKVGFRIMVANQRATGMASILSQAGKAVFRVEADEEIHHRTLAGASSLSDGYYIARLGEGYQVAGAFEPTDEQIQKFLDGRPVDEVGEGDEWIEAIARDVPPALPAESSRNPQTVSEFLGTLNEQQVRIVDLYIEGQSHAKIEREVYGKIGGDAYYKVEDVIRRYKAANTSTTTRNTAILGASTA